MSIIKTRAELDEWMNNHSPEEYDPEYVSSHYFPSNCPPRQRLFWEIEFESINQSDTPLVELVLPIESIIERLQSAPFGKEFEAIRTGIKSGQLECSDGMVTLADGWERPAAILNRLEDEREKFAQRTFWVDVFRKGGWEGAVEKDTVAKSIDERLKIIVSEKMNTTGNEDYQIEYARAAVQYGIDEDFLIPDEFKHEKGNQKIKLYDPDPPAHWEQIWKLLDHGLRTPIPPYVLKFAVCGYDWIDAWTTDEAEEYIRHSLHEKKTLMEVPDGLLMTTPGKGGPLRSAHVDKMPMSIPQKNSDQKSDSKSDMAQVNGKAASDGISTPAQTTEDLEAEIESGDTTTSNTEGPPSSTSIDDKNAKAANQLEKSSTSLSKKDSVRVFVKDCLTTDVSEEDKIKLQYQYPRIPVSVVWSAYLEFCKNHGIDPKSKYSGAKKEIQNIAGVKKGNYRYNGEKQQCYKNLKFTSEGERFREDV